MEEISKFLKNAVRNNDATGIKNMFQRLHTHAVKIPGTQPYWTSSCFQFRSISLHQAYMNQSTTSIFHTGSITEYHEYPLRLLLYNYIESINTAESLEEATQILIDNIAFAKPAQSYQHIVTHYVCVKMELWMGLFMNPTHGVIGGLLTDEFSQDRGAINVHTILYVLQEYQSLIKIHNEEEHTDEIYIDNVSFGDGTAPNTTSSIDLCMMHNSISLFNTFSKLDGFINTFYHTSTAIHVNPTSNGRKLNGMNDRESFLKTVPGGTDIWNQFNNCIAHISTTLDQNISEIMESNQGFTSIHPGHAPGDNLRPGGQEYHGYRTEYDRMQTLNDVMNENELRKIKCCRKNDLLKRQVNIVNHILTHKCNSYCLKGNKLSQMFDPLKHKEDDSNRFTL